MLLIINGVLTIFSAYLLRVVSGNAAQRATARRRRGGRLFVGRPGWRRDVRGAIAGRGGGRGQLAGSLDPFC